MIVVDGAKMRAIRISEMEALILALGFIAGNLMRENFREALVNAIKNGLQHDHIVALYQNLGIVIAEAGIDIGVN